MKVTSFACCRGSSTGSPRQEQLTKVTDKSTRIPSLLAYRHPPSYFSTGSLTFIEIQYTSLGSHRPCSRGGRPPPFARTRLISVTLLPAEPPTLSCLKKPLPSRVT